MPVHLKAATNARFLSGSKNRRGQVHSAAHRRCRGQNRSPSSRSRFGSKWPCVPLCCGADPAVVWGDGGGASSALWQRCVPVRSRFTIGKIKAWLRSPQWMRNRQAPGSASVSEETQLWQSDMLMRFGLDRKRRSCLPRPPHVVVPARRVIKPGSTGAKLNQRGSQLKLSRPCRRCVANLPAAQQDAGVLLKAQLLMARADYRAAVQVLSAQRQVCLVHWCATTWGGPDSCGQWGQRCRHPGCLGQNAARTDEQRCSATGPMWHWVLPAAEAGQPASPDYLERVPLQNGESNKALLGYGSRDGSAKTQSALVSLVGLKGATPKTPAALGGNQRLAVPPRQFGAKAKPCRPIWMRSKPSSAGATVWMPPLAFCKGRWLDECCDANAAKPASSVVPRCGFARYRMWLCHEFHRVADCVSAGHSQP